MGIPIFETDVFLQNPNDPSAIRICNELAECSRENGLAYIRDPNWDESANQTFQEMKLVLARMPFSQSMKYRFPEVFHQHAITPSHTEDGDVYLDQAYEELDPSQYPVGLPSEDWDDHEGKRRNLSMRWFDPAPLRGRIISQQFQELTLDPIVPELDGVDPKEWVRVRDIVSGNMHKSAMLYLQMIAKGLNIPWPWIYELVQNGSHLLSSTITNLIRYGALHTRINTIHKDFNVVTIHAKSSVPCCVHVWNRAGERILVEADDGADLTNCLLTQPGLELEYITGGEIMSGWHEVFAGVPADRLAREYKDKVDPEGRMLPQELIRAAPSEVPFRISTNYFLHAGVDGLMKVMIGKKTVEMEQRFPPILVGHFVEKVLRNIGFM